MNVIVAEPLTPSDPALAVAEKQLAILGELTEMSLAVSRGYAAASLAAANAVEVILSDQYWQPETGRALALAGARNAADGFQKVSRSLRLTLKLELQVAEIVRDIRAGVITHSTPVRRKETGLPLAINQNGTVLNNPCPTGADTPDLDHPETNLERLVEYDRPDRMPGGAFRETVEALAADMGVAPDWSAYRNARPLRYEPLPPKPRGRGDCHPSLAESPTAHLEGEHDFPPRASRLHGANDYPPPDTDLIATRSPKDTEKVVFSP